MLNSIYKAANNIKDQHNNQMANDYKAILKESTSNEAWNISNTKLQVLADHTHNWEDYQKIMKHLWEKLQCKPKEWRRIAKALHVMDYLVKNGAPRVIQDIKDDLYKIRAFENFTYKESNGVEQGVELRDKVKGLLELVNDPSKLQYEREFAKQTREKFMGISSTGSMGGSIQQTSGMYGGSNGQMSNYDQPTDKSKYGGFGSQDIAKMGYNDSSQFGGTGAYDPYTKTQSTVTKPTWGESDKKDDKIKKHTMDDSDSVSSSDPNEDSDDPEVIRKREKRQKKKAKQNQKKVEDSAPKTTAPPLSAQGLGMAPKANRAFNANVPTPAQQQPPAAAAKPNNDNQLLDLFSSPEPAPQQQSTAFGFMNQQQQPQNSANTLFGGMTINNSTINVNNNQFAISQPNQQQQNQNQQQQSTAFGFMNQPTESTPAAVTQAPPQKDLFGGLNMSSPQTQQPQQQVQQPVQQQQQQPVAPAKPSIWNDGTSNKLFDLSSGSLMSNDQQKEQSQQQVPSLMVNNKTASNDFADVFNQQQQQRPQQQQVSSGFQPGLNTNMLFNNQPQMGMPQQNMGMNQMQYQNQFQQQQQQRMMMQQNPMMGGMQMSQPMGMQMGGNPMQAQMQNPMYGQQQNMNQFQQPQMNQMGQQQMFMNNQQQPNQMFQGMQMNTNQGQQPNAFGFMNQ